MNRKTTEKIADLERSLAAAKRREKDEHDVGRELWALLNHLLAIEPSLEKYHQVESNWGTTWDYKGVAQAAEFRAQEAVADKYAPKKKAKA